MSLKLDNDDNDAIKELRAYGNDAVISHLNDIRLKYIGHDQPEYRAAYHYILATFYSRIGEYDKADKNFESALTEDVDSNRILLAIAKSYLRRGFLKGAKSILDNIAPNIEKNLYVRLKKRQGDYYYLTGDYKSALSCFQEFDASPEKIRLANKFLKDARHNTQDAAGSIDFAHNLYHHDGKAKPETNLAHVFLHNRVTELMNEEELNVDQKHCLQRLLGQIIKISKDYQSAEGYIDEAFRTNPRHPALCAARVQFLCHYHHHEEALAFYEQNDFLIDKSPAAQIRVARIFNRESQKCPVDLKASFSRTATDLAEALKGQQGISFGILNSANGILSNQKPYRKASSALLETTSPS